MDDRIEPGDEVPEDHVLPHCYPERTGSPTHEFGQVCDDCGERMYRFFINRGGNVRYFDRCCECGNELKVEE